MSPIETSEFLGKNFQQYQIKGFSNLNLEEELEELSQELRLLVDSSMRIVARLEKLALLSQEARLRELL